LKADCKKVILTVTWVVITVATGIILATAYVFLPLQYVVIVPTAPYLLLYMYHL
jgi:hypothetical protein